MSDGTKTFVSYASIIAIVIAGGNWMSNRQTCAEYPIPYKSSTNYVKYLETDVTQVATAGVKGSERICKHDEEIKSRALVLAPVDEVINRGEEKKTILTPVYAIPDTSTCEVTLCNDGSCSFSTGRGTCSHHGGVDRYY